MLKVIHSPKIFACLFSALLLAFSVAANAAPKAKVWSFWDKSNENSSEVIDHSPWEQILTTYLVNNHESGVNLFNYAGVSEQDAALLEEYLDAMQSLDPRTYNRSEQQAYWINLYNALTVQVILDEYPIKSILKAGKGLINIFGPWDDDVAEIAGEELTLNDIEHRILRPIWNDDRLHFAVNCASIGCPNLQPVAFTADNTEAMLQAAAHEYLSHPRGAHFDKKGRLVLSQIFEWYGVDFGDNEQEVIRKISQYAPAELGEKMRNHKGKVKYDYDWGLNKS